MPTITIALNAAELSTADLAVVGGIVQAALRRCGYVDAHRDGPVEAVAIGPPGASYEFRSLTITEQQQMAQGELWLARSLTGNWPNLPPHPRAGIALHLFES